VADLGPAATWRTGRQPQPAARVEEGLPLQTARKRQAGGRRLRLRVVWSPKPGAAVELEGLEAGGASRRRAREEKRARLRRLWVGWVAACCCGAEESTGRGKGKGCCCSFLAPVRGSVFLPIRVLCMWSQAVSSGTCD
jgi:hypothetical protein